MTNKGLMIRKGSKLIIDSWQWQLYKSRGILRLHPVQPRVPACILSSAPAMLLAALCLLLLHTAATHNQICPFYTVVQKDGFRSLWVCFLYYLVNHGGGIEMSYTLNAIWIKKNRIIWATFIDMNYYLTIKFLQWRFPLKRKSLAV